MLWPIQGQKTKDAERQAANERRAMRGDHLRASLGIGHGHVIESRKLRDHLHHFDERMDALTSVEPLIYIDGNFGPENIIGIINGSPPKVMRHFDPGENTYHFQDEEFDIGMVADGLRDILDRARKRLAEISPWPPRR